jgi:threonine/homoserine/homoserine lactone efflux protein
MQRYVIWYVLACLWAVIAIAGRVRHRTATAALEAIFALLFAIIGLFMKRRDAARYTARRPR